MDPSLMRRRVQEARVGRLATVRSDGRPHLVPCCFALDGETVTTAVDAKPKRSLALQRLDNVRANPGVALLVDHYEEDWSKLWWVRLDGAARVVENRKDGERALARLATKYEQYARQPPPGPLITIEVSTWRGWP